jgi:hypothetical protein
MRKRQLTGGKTKAAMVNTVSRKPPTKTYESKDPKSRNKEVITINPVDLVARDTRNRLDEVEKE